MPLTQSDNSKGLLLLDYFSFLIKTHYRNLTVLAGWGLGG